MAPRPPCPRRVPSRPRTWAWCCPGPIAWGHGAPRPHPTGLVLHAGPRSHWTLRCAPSMVGVLDMGGLMAQQGRADLHGVGSSALRELRRAAVEAHIQLNGMWCPGYGVPGHEVPKRGDMCADHLTPVAQGGDPAGPFGVLC